MFKGEDAQTGNREEGLCHFHLDKEKVEKPACMLLSGTKVKAQAHSPKFPFTELSKHAPARYHSSTTVRHITFSCKCLLTHKHVVCAMGNHVELIVTRGQDKPQRK